MTAASKNQDRPLVGQSLTGGLGNQMFQYAAGWSIAQRLGAELRCDPYDFSKPTMRPLGLPEFGITWTRCRNPRARGALRAIARAFGSDHGNPFRRAIYFEEEFGGFDPRVNALTAPCYLNGYYQSFRYFEGRDAEIRRLFDLGKVSSSNIAADEVRIRAAAHPVAVHIRRGDYAQPATLAFHGMLGADHYNAGRREIEARVENPTYFLFSDEPATAMAELRDWPNLIAAGGFSTHEDLKLMAMCEHFIIANSTFSWWAAWLGEAPGKQVVAPINWFAPANAHKTVLDDRYPPGWIRV